MRQTLRFLPNNAFATEEPEICKTIKDLSTRCPILFHDFLTQTDNVDSTDLNNSPQSSLKKQSDASHKSATAIHCVKQSLRLPVYVEAVLLTAPTTPTMII